MATAGHQPSHAGQVTGSGEPSSARRARPESASRASTAKGFTSRVQFPIRPHDSGTAIHSTSQKTVGTMFSARSCEPARPAATSATSSTRLARPGSGRTGPTGTRSAAAPSSVAGTGRRASSANEASTTMPAPRTKYTSGSGSSYRAPNACARMITRLPSARLNGSPGRRGSSARAARRTAARHSMPGGLAARSPSRTRLMGCSRPPAARAGPGRPRGVIRLIIRCMTTAGSRGAGFGRR